MISLLRRLSKPSFLTTTRVSKLMESSTDSSGCSRRLVALAQQLRLYKPPPLLEDIDEPSSEESNGKVVSQVGFPESVTPISGDPERFRPKRAAVLICLFEGCDGDLRVILTKRSSRLSTHSGEVALPGGKAEEGDLDDGATATREAKEEIGLDPSLVNVVAVLEPFLSKHLLRVVPVIGIMKESNAFSPRPNPAEVDEVFDAPLDMFIKDDNRRSEEREWMGCKYLVHFFDYETENKKYVIWGLTAGILIRAASIVLQSSPAFLEQSPVFKEPKIKFQNRGNQQYHVLRKVTLTVHARNNLAAVGRISASPNMNHSIESLTSHPLTKLAGLPSKRNTLLVLQNTQMNDRMHEVLDSGQTEPSPLQSSLTFLHPLRYQLVRAFPIDRVAVA